jgi:predicted Zn-ribbon and HTH transcriptional regulator
MTRTVKISKRAGKRLIAQPQRRKDILERLQRVAKNPKRRDLDIKPFEVRGKRYIQVNSWFGARDL